MNDRHINIENIVLVNVLLQYLRELEKMNNVSNWGHFSYKSGRLQNLHKWKDSFKFAVASQEIALLIIRNKDCEEIIQWCMGFPNNWAETWPKCRNSHLQALNKSDLVIFDTEGLNE